MSLSISVRQVGDVLVVDMVGRLTDAELYTFRDTLRKLISENRKKVLLNMAEVSNVDSAGIGELVSAFADLANKGGRLKLLSLTPRVRDLLQITKLITVFEVFANEAAAVRSFTAVQTRNFCHEHDGPQVFR